LIGLGANISPPGAEIKRISPVKRESEQFLPSVVISSSNSSGKMKRSSKSSEHSISSSDEEEEKK
jgi:hypothetical protein